MLDSIVRDHILVNRKSIMLDIECEEMDGSWFATDIITNHFALGKNKAEAKTRLKNLVKLYYEENGQVHT